MNQNDRFLEAIHFTIYFDEFNIFSIFKNIFLQMSMTI